REVAGALAMAGRFETRVVAMLDDRARSALGARRAIAIAAATGAIATIAACVSPEPAPAGPSPIATTAAADPALQTAAETELDRTMAAHHASGAVAIVLDARTGAPLAIATRGDLDARTPRVPGSTMKPFTIAAALDAGVVDTSTRVDCENGVHAYGDK